jgi:hypothetical protein
MTLGRDVTFDIIKDYVRPEIYHRDRVEGNYAYRYCHAPDGRVYF